MNNRRDDTPIVVSPKKGIRLADVDLDANGGMDKEQGVGELAALEPRLEDLQERLFIEGRRSVLVVLQAIDTGGKDGMIEQLFRSFNPNGASVASFKAPTTEELAHDFLWRIHPHAPARGEIKVFNRSHYEDVLITRVHDLIDKDEWKRRCDHILEFERLLEDSDTTVVKFFLLISKDEQRERLQARLDDPAKHWKFQVGDLAERLLWDKYQETFEDVINRTTTESAPWVIVPANRKWYRNIQVCRYLIELLEDLDPKLPKANFDPATVVIPA